eukprot:CAMPEP_0116117114 /NCGR_PEP_ID=MMETSP0329-20121206/1396_1 /TAXON_ID=697910 /ORGANISM="Pseudo-nitzschia arenysensis, Strain B593" /LENGTH=235 /DNA_ID=CAMNT_0003610649 /DNA_START=321 /DNA_END=1030 /DNA_ORIENTATION=-
MRNEHHPPEEFGKQQNVTSIIDSPSWLDSNTTSDICSNSSHIDSSTIFVDGELEPRVNSPSKLPVSPTAPSTTFITIEAPSVLPIEYPTTSTPSATEAPISAKRPLPISGDKATNMNYVASNIKPRESSSESKAGSENNDSIDNDIQDSPLSPAFASLPMAGDNTIDNQEQEEQPEEESVEYVASIQKESTSVSINPPPTALPAKQGKKSKYWGRERKARKLISNRKCTKGIALC